MRLGNSSLFTFAIQGSNDEFRVVDFEGKERVSAPFYFVVTIATTNFELDASTIIDKSACLQLFAEEEAPRYIHGCIESVMMMDVGRRFATYQLVLLPKLHRLAYRSQHKIFQQQDAQQMMRTILIDAGLIEGDDFRFEITGTLPQRTYTTQYAESDLDFFNRILAEDGLHYHFQFSADRHVLLISDTQYIFQRLTETPEIPFVAHTGLLKRDYVIHDFSLCTKLQPNKVTLKDYNFTKPSLNLETSEQTGSGDFEVYHHGGLYQEPELGQQQVQTLLKAFQATSECGHGESNCVYLSAGKLFKLTDHNNPVFNQEYLLLEVRHAGAQPQSLEEGASSGPSGYMSQFICIPKTTEFKAKPPKPKINKRNRFDGVQNATVVGPKREEIYTDQYGRIKVQFNWDKDGQADEKSSRWIRVTQPWTGSSWGAIQIPRIGQEILISFVNGDPDRPLIKGVMYNGRNKPPYKLPDNKTRTTVKTCSTPGGQGFNELRFEDKKTHEQIFIHGERDQDIKIENDKDLRVYRDSHLVVDKQHHIHIKQLLSESINGTWKEDLWNNQYITVKQNFTEKAAKNYNREAGKEIHIKSTGKMVFDAGMQLSVSGSGSYFTLDPSGVKINGPTVRINAGGSPGRGAATSPKNPVTADNTQDKKPYFASQKSIVTKSASLEHTTTTAKNLISKSQTKNVGKEEDGWKPVPSLMGYPALIFATRRRKFNHDLPKPNRGDDGQIVPDLRHGDEDRATIEEYGYGKPFKNTEDLYSMREGHIIKKGEDQFKLPAEQHFDRMRKLGHIFSNKWILDTPTINIFYEMVDKFQRNEGGTYSHSSLTEALKLHESTKSFNNALRIFLKEYVLCNLALNTDLTDQSFNFMVNDSRGVGIPKFDKWSTEGWDLFTGGVITVHDVYAMEVYVDKLEEKDNQIRGKFIYHIQDHFGLDSPDINHESLTDLFKLFEQMEGFRSWYLLQHYKGYNYKPFTTEIDFELGF
ncbi:type VI secretion system tip protein TssI/VgrG [Zooshikella harenae]|uniref:Type VI secretion system tip protein VgrG n=1 Tax=Zooshikella harenae TaxID=2827238 RepID=A0ABS5ZIT5_9GAMM|nr:type VI secretion system tip protein TssI/VgrG [Zooshikella harenae]MBU2713992.1 type VI secretion system tip protein VgrG [Zooshikella harenae]